MKVKLSQAFIHDIYMIIYTRPEKYYEWLNNAYYLMVAVVVNGVVVAQGKGGGDLFVACLRLDSLLIQHWKCMIQRYMDLPNQ